VIASRCSGWLLATVALACAVVWGAEQAAQTPVPKGKPALPSPVKTLPAQPAAGPRPLACPAPSPEAIDSAIQHGVAFLLARQNHDGSWGSAHRTKGLDIYAPVPGAHQAFRAGVTALCIAALLETAHDSGKVATALDGAEGWLLEHLPKLRRATPDAIYNNWGHAYGIHALALMLRRRPDDQGRAARIRTAIEQQIDLLGRYECVDGGWCYYDFVARTQQPSGSSISFVSAAALTALKEAERVGVKVPERLVRRAVASILRQRKPDFSYCYGEYLKYTPMHPVNRPGGSLGRSQVCNLALRLWGDVAVTDDVLRIWLDRLFARNMWLDIGRKRPIPHESWFAVAGYFFYFGHYYAARCIEELPPGQRASYQDHLGQVLLQLQEKDGSWWDFPLYDYHQQYGTAFALMSLKRCAK
jgi:hypothetical protein